jgi:hypothetical protein
MFHIYLYHIYALKLNFIMAKHFIIYVKTELKFGF